jgi:mono/diheme cytochrome c family protein
MKIVIGLLLGLLLMPLAVYFYFASGMAPVATTDSDMPFEHLLAHKALEARIAKDMPKTVPIQPTDGNYLDGAELYKQHCGVCHGLPLAPRTAISAGMFPQPPLLLQGTGVTDDAPGITYWKISNGIRLTGMPGFSKSLSETQMWQIALLVANADKLPTAAKAALVTPVGASPGIPTMPLATPVPPPPAFPSSAPQPK